MALVLASRSDTRRALFAAACVPIETVDARVDEASIRDAMIAEGCSPRDISDALAEAKARKVSAKRPGDIVLGCDQVLDFDGMVLAKPADPEDAMAQLAALSGRRHMLHSAMVAYEDGEPIWRHVGTARLTMRQLSPGYIGDYVARNWDEIRHSVVGYQVEAEGMRLFAAIDGDFFTVQGLPMLPLLSWLTLRGIVPT
ncbi:septum formation protein [Palleronia marisminoris]|uniref:Nucleoside triphosphate pyrophosphatase n=1 Tax=Palleronia marisminoris TaxID=315423 RepID=A0A1Y5T3A2_9RHOB|nr:Maf family protein [Palleronia marisminoris]SFH06397.1 septum formation protein [Palleronia marisminoris]SLN51343.1 Maf-like protein YceF [Palleronia marisminoris]